MALQRRTVLTGLAAAVTLPAWAETPLMVFAAASLGGVLDQVTDAWQAGGGAPVRIVYGASSTLARQIQHGAPADIYLSANAVWMDILAERGMLQPGSRRDLLTNRLVLVGHGAAGSTVRLSELPSLLGDNRLATALVDSVPAGIYAQQALKASRIWDALRPRLVQTDDVRAALAFVARGEVPYAIVYATDAALQPNVHIAAKIASALHAPIIYPVAAMTASEHSQTTAFLDHLTSDTAAQIFLGAGFGRAG